ncbi:ORF50 [Agrotis segetum granulovirus]|uniref:ORF50 n=1 Tax=Agrotis segetum granulosis virus TaxID=10464 RepID=Q6QXJ3_GVAS|nr:hypothetical protein AsGV059 [Agrotis segetum granulovirus]AAS82688.1 ORF50 [Agrotis segetum granulovirus]AHN92098.1 hypothetical protein AsGV059 [Agrotis segetum granulovirus]AKN63333.1 hypothetical protein AsGV059 [Agrotis segetum granulovirus]
MLCCYLIIMNTLMHTCVKVLVENKTKKLPIYYLHSLVSSLNGLPLTLKRLLREHLPLYYIDDTLLSIERADRCRECRAAAPPYFNRLPQLFCVKCIEPLFSLRKDSSIEYINSVCRIYKYTTMETQIYFAFAFS